MSPSTPFIRRPVATTLLTFGLAAAGVVAFFKLPVSPLPQVDFPTISVQATLPGASPQDVATTVASPLERHLGQIADVTEMTSSSTVGSTRITLQFGLNRDINGAARDVLGCDKRGARRSADQPAHQSDLPQGQPGRRADPGPDADLRHCDAWRGLRCGIDCTGAKTVASRRHRRGRRRR